MTETTRSTGLPPDIYASDEESTQSIRDRLASAQARCGEFYDDAREKVIAGARTTDTAIRENPYISIAVALGIGVLVGYLIGGRRSPSDEMS